MRLAVMGAGAVGSAVAEMASDYGHRVVALANSTSAVVDPDGVDAESALARQAAGRGLGSADPEVVPDGEYDLLVEATPTTLDDAQPGFSHVRAALESDRHVVLANKGPVAERFDDLRALERASAGRVRFEATVGGAVPVLATVEDVGPGRVEAVRGVLNGTANFVLSRMAAEGLDYDHILAEAQDLGVAEADPSMDVEGTDAALKCVVLANVLSGASAGRDEGEDGRTAGEGDDPDDGRTFALADATVEGIAGLPGEALDLAAEDGRTVRLVGEATREGVRVGPRLVPREDPLAVSGTRNVVQIETARTGRLTLGGRGAGGAETATAVLSDVDRIAAAEE